MGAVRLETTDEPILKEVAQQRRKRIRRGLAVLLFLVLAVLAWGAFRVSRELWLRGYEAACAEARERADWAELERQATAWASHQPERALPWLYAGEAAQRQGDLGRTAEYLLQVPDGDPRTPAALLELSDLLFYTLNRPLEGAATCERILRVDPTNDEAHRRLIFFYAMTVQRQKMIRQARRAIDLGCDTPETFIYLIGADWLTFSNAFDLNTRWLEADPDNELFLVAKAIHFAGTKGVAEGTADDPALEMTAQRAEHERRLRNMLERFPKNLELLAYFLQQACTDGDRRKVGQLLAQAPPEAAEDNRFWRFQGWLLNAQGKLKAGERAYREALDRNPFDWHSQHELAGVLRRLERYDEVQQWVDRAMEGKALRKIILELPDVQSAPASVLARIADYAEDCGDLHIADALRYRLTNTP
jgi:tetratricopeptide (TPR) repeat protein